MDRAKLDEIRRGLEAELASVREQLAGFDADPEENGALLNVDEGFADSAQATAERSEALGKIEQLRTHHGEVAGALKAMDEGTYGKCERCGREIPDERLEAIPTVRLCVGCKQAAGT